MNRLLNRARGSLVLAAAVVLGLAVTIRPTLADPPHPVLYKGERLMPIEIAAGKPLEVKGWTRDGKGLVYSLHVRNGDRIGVNFWTPSRFTYLVMFDVSKPDDEAFFSSDEDGNITVLAATGNTTWLIRPYYSRVSPRRGMGAPYTIVLDRR